MIQHEEEIRKNVKSSHEASSTSRYMDTGLTDQKVKLNSKNFDKLMRQRGLSKKERESLKATTEKGIQMQVRHAKAGEKFMITHRMERSSGVFLSEKSLGATPDERIDKGALPHFNTAEYETKVELSREQNLVYGKIASQSKFSKMDPKQAPRSGGGEQIITDGGYNSGAIINRDSKYPVPASSDFQKRASEYKSQYSQGETTRENGSDKGNHSSKGQSM